MDRTWWVLLKTNSLVILLGVQCLSVWEQEISYFQFFQKQSSNAIIKSNSMKIQFIKFLLFPKLHMHIIFKLSFYSNLNSFLDIFLCVPSHNCWRLYINSCSKVTIIFFSPFLIFSPWSSYSHQLITDQISILGLLLKGPIAKLSYTHCLYHFSPKFLTCITCFDILSSYIETFISLVIVTF